MLGVLLVAGNCARADSGRTSDELSPAAARGPSVEPVVYETPPIILAASDILPADLLQGKYHRVAERVENDGYMNHYTIETEFGTFEAEGNAALRVTIVEISAIAQLKEVSKTEAFADAMKRSAAHQGKAVANTVQHPVQTTKKVPGGVKRFVKRTSRKVKDFKEDAEEHYDEYQDKKAEKKARRAQEEAARKEAEAAGEVMPEEPEEGLIEGTQEWWDEQGEDLARQGGDFAEDYAKDWIGYTGARRHWAGEMGVDPYSDNQVLNQELYRVAQGAAAGGFSMRWVPIPSIDVLGYLEDVNDLVWKMDPLDLRMRNEKLLYGMGVSEETVEALYENKHQSPTLITFLVDALVKLEGVEGREHWVIQARDAESRVEAEFHLRGVNFLAEYHRQEKPLVRIINAEVYPQGLLEDGNLVLAAPFDHVHWTEELAIVVEQWSGVLKEQVGAQKAEIWIEGGTSEQALAAAESYGFEVHTNAFLGMKVTFGERGKTVEEAES